MMKEKYMRHKKIYKALAVCLTAAMLTQTVTVAGAQQTTQGSLGSVTEESQILPIPDGSGKYILKSSGFYCLNEDGTRESTPAVHYFDHFVIDGTVFDGYYYHDESGKFAAGNSHMIQLKDLTAMSDDGSSGEISFDGFYMVNNLGKLSAAPQVRYMDDLVVDKTTYNGFYYFNEYGKMVTDKGIHDLKMSSAGQMFDGYYYFGGENGVLVQEAGETPEGFPVDETGKVETRNLGMKGLKTRLTELLDSYEGTWSVYVKDLTEDKEFELNSQSLYSASLIKVFVMAQTYANMDTVLQNEAAKLKKDVSDPVVSTKVNDLLWNMITVSDNESFNELVRLQTASGVFKDGAEAVNAFLEANGYKDTSVQHILSPSSSKDAGLGGRNTTSVKDCAQLLEQIYNGECVSKEASEAMLNLLLNQQVTTKIPSGVSASVEIANKTGETDTDQHDIAIVYGENTTYILCVMSENCQGGEAVSHIQDISGIVYNYLNMQLDQA